MCKHLLIRDFSHEDISLIKEFAEITYDKDGFGAIVRTNNNEIKTIKSVELASFYMDLTGLILTEKINELVVHHRTSTNGQGIDYSHPFEFQGNYLTHNGVITVPDKHDVKTTNDSEALLHHLIKTDFETKSISGYFSCFVLNEVNTTILVDATAPIYSDGRVFSSHNLIEGMEKIELKRVVFDRQGVRTETPIEVTKNEYGMDKASLSLGFKYHDWSSDYRDDAPLYPVNKKYVYDEYYSNVDKFFEVINFRDEDYLLYHCKTNKERAKEIWEIAELNYIKLSRRQVKTIIGDLMMLAA